MGSKLAKQSPNDKYSDDFEDSTPAIVDLGVNLKAQPGNRRKDREGHNKNATSFRRNTHTTQQSARRSMRRKLLDGIQLTELTVWRDNRPTDIDETQSDKSLSYRVAKFRASATVTFPKIPTDETWQVGWVQACYYIKFVNQYGAFGYTSWEFPQLTRGQICVNDSDGNKFPWYSFRKGMHEIKGPTKTETIFNVVMTDSPSSRLSMSVPSPHYQARRCLSTISRNQQFKVWLVVRNVDTDDVYPFKCISWELSCMIGVTPTKEQGERARVLEGPQKAPIIHKEPHSLPLQALLAPECNKAQALIWRPTDPKRKVSVIVPPDWTGAPPLTTKDLENPFLIEEERQRKQMAQRFHDLPALTVH